MPVGSRCLFHFAHLRREAIPKKVEPGKPGLGLDHRLRELEVTVQNGAEMESFTAQDRLRIWVPMQRPENRNDELSAVPQAQRDHGKRNSGHDFRQTVALRRMRRPVLPVVLHN